MTRTEHRSPRPARLAATLLALGLLAALPLAPAAPAAEPGQTLVSDPLSGATLGEVRGEGQFVPGGGWRTDGGFIVYDAGRQISSGSFEATMRGFSVPAQGAAKSHPLSCWESEDTYTHYTELGAYWNWRTGTNYDVFKVLASYQGIKALPDDPFPRKEARVGAPEQVNDGQPHRYRVEWHEGVVSFFIDGDLLRRFELPRFSVRYCTIGRDDFYPHTSPAPIISDVLIVDAAAPGVPAADLGERLFLPALSR